MRAPSPNTYWVIPGRFLAGEHPCATAADAPARLRLLSAAGIDYFYDLTYPHEMPDYRAWLPPHAKYTRTSIGDMEVPEEEARMHEIQARIRSALLFGRSLYLHCRAGIGRTGLVVGCYLIEQGLDGPAALARLNELWRECERSKSWPEIPQTAEQADYVRRWVEHRVRAPAPAARGRRLPRLTVR